MIAVPILKKNQIHIIFPINRVAASFEIDWIRIKTDLDKNQLDIDIIIKEEIMEDFQHDFDIPSIKVSEPFEPMKIPKFLKEVSVSLQKLNKSEILKHTQAKGEVNVKNIKIHMYKHPTLMLWV